MPTRIAFSGVLSGREEEILRLLMAGLSNKEVAASLGISIKTVEEHLIKLYRKARVRSRTQAVLWGIGRLRVIPH